MDEKVLIVDDDLNILASYQRSLRGHFQVTIAEGGTKGLQVLRDEGPFTVVVADYKMPQLDGMQFLSVVRKFAPDTIRIMLTGHADLQTVLAAINRGGFFRFLLKPCTSEDMREAIKAGIEQHRLLIAERDLLEKTLRGTINALMETLSMVCPVAFSHSSRVSHLSKRLAISLKVETAWEMECAALLSQIGCVTLTADTLHKKYYGEPMTLQEELMFARHPLIARHLLSNIPRLERVAEAVAYQEKRFDGTGSPPDERQGTDIPLMSRILKLVLDYDLLVARGTSEKRALEEMRGRIGWYDPEVLVELEKEIESTEAMERHVKWVIRELSSRDIGLGMRLVDDVMTKDGMLLFPRNWEVTYTCKLRLENYAQLGVLAEPLKVRERMT
jgi:response regulator RpfG family c-di-GMP phosphodiesterase